MSKGINRALSFNEELAKTRLYRGKPCVFLSHQKKDSDACKKIATYLQNADIDVYFDENDKDLKFYRQTDNPKGVVNSIKTGINNSTHMLCVISKNTLYSKWVPWEVGYGHDLTKLGVLTLRDISNTEIPDYLKTTEVLIRGTESIEKYIETVNGRALTEIYDNYNTRFFSAYSHPLKDILDYGK